DGEHTRRSYSMCISPVDTTCRVAVKPTPEGTSSSFGHSKSKTGDTLEVVVRSGPFAAEANPNEADTYLFFAAGSGITPVLSMIEPHLALEPNATCKLFYVNRIAKSIIFKETLEQPRHEYFGRLEIYYFLAKERRDIELFNGRFDDEKMRILTKTFIDIPDTREVFLCGPEEMVNYVSNDLIETDVPNVLVHLELFVPCLTEVYK